MERKNVIFLSVIAVATLLTAVVGTTFAYFTASVTTTGDGNKIEVTTKTLVSAEMDLGSTVTAVDVFPGHEEVKALKYEASGNGEAIQAVISVTASIPEAFGSNVGWKLYKVTEAEYNAVTTKAAENTTTNSACTNEQKVGKIGDTNVVKYWEEASCPSFVKVDEGTSKNLVISGSTAGTVTNNVTINAGEKAYFILDVKYNNVEDNAQDGEQTKSYSVSLSFDADANQSIGS